MCVMLTNVPPSLPSVFTVMDHSSMAGTTFRQMEDLGGHGISTHTRTNISFAFRTLRYMLHC